MTEEKKDAKPVEDKKADEAKEEKKNIEVPAKFKDLVKQIEELSVLDLAELVEILEDKFGVSAAAPIAVAAPGAAGGEDAAEEKSEFDIELIEAGEQKIQIIKIVRQITGKGLKDAKDMVDAAPKVIKEKVINAGGSSFNVSLNDPVVRFAGNPILTADDVNSVWTEPALQVSTVHNAGIAICKDGSPCCS